MPTPLTLQDLQIPCDYGIYECLIPSFKVGEERPAKLLGTYKSGFAEYVIVVSQSHGNELLNHFYATDIGLYLRLIEPPETTRQITYEDLVKLDWASYYYRPKCSKSTFLASRVGTLHMTCPDDAKRVFVYDELDGYFLPRPFAPESEWISTTVTE